MNEVTRDEFNGLGGRVTDIKEHFIECKAERGERIVTLEREMGESKGNIEVIKKDMQEIKQKITGLTVRLTTATAIIVLVIQIAMDFVQKLIK